MPLCVCVNGRTIYVNVRTVPSSISLCVNTLKSSVGLRLSGQSSCFLTFYTIPIRCTGCSTWNAHRETMEDSSNKRANFRTFGVLFQTSIRSQNVRNTRSKKIPRATVRTNVWWFHDPVGRNSDGAEIIAPGRFVRRIELPEYVFPSISDCRKRRRTTRTRPHERKFSRLVYVAVDTAVRFFGIFVVRRTGRRLPSIHTRAHLRHVKYSF